MTIVGQMLDCEKWASIPQCTLVALGQGFIGGSGAVDCSNDLTQVSHPLDRIGQG